MKRTHRGRPRVDDDDTSAQICLTVSGKQFDALDREAKLASGRTFSKARVTVQDIIRRELDHKTYTK